jgi:hypothetical protein
MSTEKFIAIGPFCWGAGETIAEARKQLRRAAREVGSSLTKNGYLVYRCHPDSSVSDLGGIEHPRGETPMVVLDTRPKKG